MKKLLSQIIAGILGLWLAILFLPEVKVKILSDSSFFGIPLTNQWQIIVLVGVILGLLNFFVRPILSIITLPLRIITLGLFTLVINMVLIWSTDLIFQELTIPWFWPLFWTSSIIWGLGIILSASLKKRRKI